MSKPRKPTLATPETPTSGPSRPASERKGEGTTESTPNEADALQASAKPKSRWHGKAGRSGAPKGNANATRHGLAGGKLPKGCQYIENRVNSLRRQIEDALLEVKGEINIVDAAAVNSILKWERHGLLASHWLRKEADKLSAGDRLRFSEAIAKASDNRDRSIRSLQLDRDRSEDVLDALYKRPVIETNGDTDEPA